jgi:hypothetical protein
MTDYREPTPVQLGQVLHRMFVDIRLWASLYERDPDLATEQTGLTVSTVAELADIAEIIPLQLIHRDEGYLQTIVSSLNDFAAEHPFARRYVAALESVPNPLGHPDCGAPVGSSLSIN